MVDHGFDVWLGNTRGNTYSRSHTNLDPNTDEDFWNFDWDDAAQNDLPAVIDYILEETKRDTINYVGHSMGSTEMLVLLSEQPNQNAKLNKVVLLAPVAFMGHVQGAMATFAPYVNTLESLLGSSELFPDMKWTTWLGHNVCNDPTNLSFFICTSLARNNLDVSPNQLNSSMLPIYMDNWPGEYHNFQPLINILFKCFSNLF